MYDLTFSIITVVLIFIAVPFSAVVCSQVRLIFSYSKEKIRDCFKPRLDLAYGEGNSPLPYGNISPLYTWLMLLGTSVYCNVDWQGVTFGKFIPTLGKQ
jgi:hypothetical protein